MSKGKHVRFCAMALAAIVLAGCSGKELSERGRTGGERRLEEENAGERHSGEGKPEEGDAGEEKDTGEKGSDEGSTGRKDPEEGSGKEGGSKESGENASVSTYPKVIRCSKGQMFYQILYAEGCYCIFDGHHYGFLTEEGEEVTPFLYEWAAPFSEGLACVCLDGKYGFIGKEGEVKVPFLYDQASPFTDGMAYFRKGEDYGFLDHEGQVVLRPDCDSVSSFQEGRAYFSVDGLYGYLDNTGKVVVEPVYEDAGSFRDGLAMVRRNGFYGLIGINGEEILPPVYDNVKIEEGFLLAKKEGQAYCFDRDGKALLEAERWDSICVREGMLVAKRDGLYGLIDRDGKVLLELECESLRPIPGKELVIVEKDGAYGVTDHSGRVKVPFAYDSILYDDDGAGGLLLTRVEEQQEGEEQEGRAIRERRKEGYLGFTGGDSFVEIPVVYDSLSFFTENRAVAGRDGKYGIIRRDGSLEYPLEYDDARLFENGTAALWTGEKVMLTDKNGSVICTGTYEAVALYGKCYQVKQGGKYGLLNERGELVVPAFYDASYGDSVCGAKGVLDLRRYLRSYHQDTQLLIMTDEGAGVGMPEVFLQNHVTPRRKEYLDLLQAAEREDDLNLSELDQSSYRSFGKLYRMGGEVILYHCSEPYERMGFPMSASGFYALRDGKAVGLAAGEECGGSMRGDYVCFWYDRAESRVKLGVAGNWGGFGGYSDTGAVYELQREGAKVTADWMSVWQISANYEQEELLKNAGLFYDKQGKPYTRETVLEAEYVTEYQVDGRQVSQERFAEVQDRYRYRNALDLY